ncbi:hypothetical protein ACIQNI_28740 [Streptomyces sp. NPDC091266]|uniref:hypothetical protein n=1 Tax=Streptomyces sp. NPDC091266 TaxID=3365978 RepID=UPI0038200A58
MLMRNGPCGLRPDTELDDQRGPSQRGPRLQRRLPVTYSAFCRDQWAIYQSFSVATLASARTGTTIAQAVLHDLGDRWDAALRTSSPAAYAWNLLSRRVCEHRPRSGLHRLLARNYADALVLRYKLGLSPLESGHAMGMTQADFEMLRHRALLALSQPLPDEYADGECPGRRRDVRQSSMGRTPA